MPTLPEFLEVARLKARFPRAGTVARTGLTPVPQSAMRVVALDA